jgi:amino acid transporter
MANTDEKLGLKELIAMGVGGMVGGGIFSVLGLAVLQAGHAAPIAFLLGGIIALLTGWSYAKLGTHFQSDGGTFTFLEKAFKHQNIAAMAGWVLLLGYIGTISLYAYTFGVYGSVLFGQDAQTPVFQHLLASGVLLIFLAINLYGVRAAGSTEDIIVLVKVVILALFAISGLIYLDPQHIQPVFDKGGLGLLFGAALIFVAYEGFELIPNAVKEMKKPEKNITRGIMWSISITIVIYVLVSLVAVGNLSVQDINKYKEYALAEAAKPFLGQAGFILIGLGAVLSTASAINATLFGTARLGLVMAEDDALPKVFSLKERTKNIPWISLWAISIASLIFVNTANLTIIASFASATFLLIFSSVNLAAFKLRKTIKIQAWSCILGGVLSFSALLGLLFYTQQTSPKTLLWMAALFVGIILLETLFKERKRL